MRDIPSGWLVNLAKVREKLKNGDETTQGELDAICSEWKSRRHLLRPREKDERFDLVDSNGQPNKLHCGALALPPIGATVPMHTCAIALDWLWPWQCLRFADPSVGQG